MKNIHDMLYYDSLSQSFLDGLRSAIAASDLSAYGLAKVAGLRSPKSVQLSEIDTQDILLESADKLAVAFGLEVVREVEGLEFELRGVVGPSKKPLSDALRSAIAASGFDADALGQQSGVAGSLIHHFIKGRTDIRFFAADKLATALGFKVIRKANLPRPESRARFLEVDRAGPISTPLSSAIVTSGLSFKALGKATHVPTEIIDLFSVRRRNPTLGMADNLAVVLGLALIGDSKGSELELGAGIEHSKEPFSATLRSAIAATGLSTHDLETACKIEHDHVLMFSGGEKPIDLAGADKLAGVLGLKVVRCGKVRRPVPAFSSPQRSILRELCLALVASGLSANVISKRSCLDASLILSFIGGRAEINFSTFKKLAESLGSELDPARFHDRLAGAFTPGEVRPAPDPGWESQVSPAEHIGTISEQVNRSQEPNPWEAWDTKICPVRVDENEHLIVFGKDKGPLKSESAILLVSELVELYPGGFNLPELENRFKGARMMIDRLRKGDADCRHAFRMPGRKNGGLYRIGRPDYL